MIDFDTFYSNDPLNKNHRTIHNADKREYNCGGYAFGLFNWYCPYESYDMDWFEDNEHHTTSAILKMTTEYMLKTLPFIRKIDDPLQCGEKEYCVAYRIDKKKEDFHFWKLSKNGIWYDKMGQDNYINRHKFYDVYKPWIAPSRIYNSKIVFFAVLYPECRGI